jgi:uncharacterized membrane protein
MNMLGLALATAHVLAGAAWFGAMFYSLAVLHPRARTYFGDSSRMEEFVTWIAAGARWKVLGGCAVITASGVALAATDTGNHSQTWWYCVSAKGLLLLLSITVFAHASWVLWPARLLAAPAEIPRHQERFRIVAITLLCLVGANMTLGIVAARADREHSRVRQNAAP